ncbi:MAG TPA: alginate export family protein [Gammaproteobacteria bacterium]|nr:alginate export family protein [Gammaproteobacteria bacterium]
MLGAAVLVLALPLTMTARAQPEDGAAAVRLGFQQRSRYQVFDNDPRPNTAVHDQALELQTSMFVEAGRGNVRFNGELIDERTELNDAQSFLNTNHVDTLEPLQVNVSWDFSRLLAPGYTSSLKIGRFTTDIGRRRFVSRSSARNTITSYSGAEWRWRGPDGRNAQVFWAVPMRILPADKASLLANDQALDLGNRGTTLRGAYYQFRELTNPDRYEAYWFGLDQANRPNNDALPRHFDTFGFRAFRPNTAGKWSYEVELVTQHGTSSATVGGVTRRDLVHDAQYAHWEFGYTFASRMAPLVLLQYDRASGDRDPYDGRNEAFDPLFGERRFDFVPQGIYTLIARSNLRTPGIRLQFKPWPRLQAMLSYRSFALDAARDAWSGIGFRDVTGQTSRTLGRQLEGSFTWNIVPNRLAFENGFAHMWAGPFFRETAGAGFRGNPMYVYTMVTKRFGGRTP